MSNETTPPSDDSGVNEEMGINLQPNGIDGWLLLPAIAFVIGPIMGVLKIYGSISAFVGVAPAIPKNIFFLVLVAIAIDVVMTIAVIIVAILFFKKLSIAVPACIGLQVASVIVRVISACLNTMLEDSVGEDVLEVVGQSIVAFIWILYFQKSRRVANTFIN